MLRPLVFSIRSFVLVSVSLFRLWIVTNRNRYICVSSWLIFQMIDLEFLPSQAWSISGLDLRRFLLSGRPSIGEERGLISRTAAGNRLQMNRCYSWYVIELYWNYFVSAYKIVSYNKIKGSSFSGWSISSVHFVAQSRLVTYEQALHGVKKIRKGKVKKTKAKLFLRRLRYF